jgi:hypothetical protein
MRKNIFIFLVSFSVTLIFASVAVCQKSTKPDKKFTFYVQDGKKISASVFPAKEYGRGKKIVIFTPSIEYSDGNFYNACLQALFNIYGKQRGLFQLEDAEKEYDSTIHSKVIYWYISNPRQKFYSYPMVDTDTGTIVSVVIWIE